MALTDSLIAYWKLDEASGTRNDSHGANHLTDNNTVASATGKINSGADFEATDSDYLSIADNAALSLGADTDFTLSLWFKPESVGIQVCLVHKNNDFVGALTTEYTISTDTLNRINFNVGNGAGTGLVQSGAALSVGVWLHILAWHSSADDKVYLQLNNATPIEAVWAGGTQNTASQFSLSSQFGGLGGADGVIDEVAFWKRILTSQERTDLYGAGAGLPYSSFAGGAAAGSSGDTEAWFFGGSRMTKTVLLKASSATVASAAESAVNVPNGCRGMIVRVGVTAASGTSPTLNVYIQDGTRAPGTAAVGEDCDGAYEFEDYISFTQITTAASKVARKDFSGEEEAAASDVALTAGQLRNGPISDRVRVKYVIGGTNPSFTFSVRVLFIY